MLPDKKWLYILIVLFGIFHNVSGNTSDSAKQQPTENKFSDHVDEFIMHHIGDDYKWQIVGETYLYLPVIVFNLETKEFAVFSSKILNDGSYKGYLLSHGKLERPDGATFIDISITKNVVALFFSAFLLVLIFVSIARSYGKREGKAPKGLQSFLEPVIFFVRDDITRPVIGEKKYEQYLPY
ncbi:MAG: hypothetical protein RQ866_00215, partial [Bacteroidales bacterium]|nr:hypothetical protein [Bacteroidales bacterium]